MLPQGVIRDGHALLFVRGVDRQEEDLKTYTAEELSEAEHACGQKMVAALSIDHTRGTEGRALAKRVIDGMLARWGGYHFDGGG